MSDVFISYTREDRERVAPLVAGLREAGLSVWWDRDLAGGESWRQRLIQQLEAARCVVVVWSRTSVGPAGEFVHDEAGRAKARGVLLPVRLDAVSEPLGFGEIQSFDLTGWGRRPKAKRFQRFVAAVRAKVTGDPPPRALEPGRMARWTAAGVLALTVGTAALGVVADLVGLREPLCHLPGVHALCRHWGLVATAEEEALWEARPEGDCGVLREYLARFPTGAFAAEAERRLQAMTVDENPQWKPAEYSLRLVVRPSLTAHPSEEAARADALARAPGDARLVCEGFSSATYRLLKATAEVDEWRCLPRGEGIVCGFDGKALCQIEVQEIHQQEVCQ